jgi:hypothetical protein
MSRECFKDTGTETIFGYALYEPFRVTASWSS